MIQLPNGSLAKILSRGRVLGYVIVEIVVPKASSHHKKGDVLVVDAPA